MNNPNCYNCKHRRNIPGSAHSQCVAVRVGDGSFPTIFELALASRKFELIDKSTNEPLIKLNPHGVENGWAMWPVNFDPVWVDNCVLMQTL